MTVDEIPGGGVALYVILIFYPALAPGGSCPRAGLSSPYRVIAAFWRRLPAFCALFREGGGTRLLLCAAGFRCGGWRSGRRLRSRAAAALMVLLREVRLRLLWRLL